ncbi:PucR family transcriptional regulator [Dietzia sp.]|uniref:PucR family transcriptional regulator n=1 Tax=Dietzia sp. TaxID=1871616 RepID=UPI002FD9153D
MTTTRSHERDDSFDHAGGGDGDGGNNAAAGASPPPIADSTGLSAERIRKARTEDAERSRGISDALLRRFTRYSGRLSTEAVQWLDSELPFFKALPADQKSQIHLIIQSAIRDFANWTKNPGAELSDTIAGFKLLPGTSGQLLSLQQTVQLVRSTLDYFELVLPRVTHNQEQRNATNAALLRYGRELGFTAAAVYAGAAEDRGSWDTRMEAMLVDAIIRGDDSAELASASAALNWDANQPVTVIVGRATANLGIDTVNTIHLAAQSDGRQALAVVQGARLVVALSGPLASPTHLPERIMSIFDDGPVVLGPTVDGLDRAPLSAFEALKSFDVVAAWPNAPRPVTAIDLLPERILAGDETARHTLVDMVVGPIRAADPTIAETLAHYLEHGGQVEACARELFVHPNTVRYRLKRVAQITQFDPLRARDQFVLKIAVALGSLQ